MSRWKIFAAVAAVGALGVLATAQVAAALEPGDAVTFLLPVDANQPELPASPNGRLIYHGGHVTMVETTGCGLGSQPMQNATLVDPSGIGGSGRIEGVITIHTEPIRPGTKLSNLTLLGPCSIGTAAYFRYEGIVE